MHDTKTSFYFVTLFLSQLQVSHKQRWISLVHLTRYKKKNTMNMYFKDIQVTYWSKASAKRTDAFNKSALHGSHFHSHLFIQMGHYLISYSEGLCLKNRISFPFMKDKLKWNIFYKTCLPQKKELHRSHSPVNCLMFQSSLQEQQVQAMQPSCIGLLQRMVNLCKDQRLKGNKNRKNLFKTVLAH